MGDRISLRARYVFPVTAPPLANGVVAIEHGTIVDVGSRAPANVEDLGNVAILPGLVNAHTHLEFSGLSAPLGRPGMGMVDWIRSVIEYRRQPRMALQQALELGLEESYRSGTTTLAEIAQPTWPAERFDRMPVSATVFAELIAPTVARIPEALEFARRHLDAGKASGRWRPGLSPHAPYSVHPNLLAAAVRLSASEKVPLAMHLAESWEEVEWLRSGGGPFGDFLRRLDGWDPSAFPPGRRPLDCLRVLADSHRALVVHGNYLDDDEVRFLAANADRTAVVYCPRTHAHFGHGEHPVRRLLAAGATVALGTDSRASSPDLSLLAEMRFVAGRQPKLPRDLILNLGTLAGARALGREREIGSLEPGKRADLAVVALAEREASDPHELLLDSDGRVVATWTAECGSSAHRGPFRIGERTTVGVSRGSS